MLWFEQSWLLLLVDVSVKSLALALMAWFALAALRVKNANVRHRVWSAVLLAMVALPLLVPVTPSVPIPTWMMPQFSIASVEEPLELGEVVPVFEESIPAPSFTSVSQLDTDGSDYAAAEPTELNQAADVSVAVPLTEQIALSPPASVVAPAFPSYWSRWPTVLFFAYGVIVCGFVFRILAGIWGTQCIVARSTPVTSDSERENGASLYESNDLLVPLTVGFLRPKILLPVGWRMWTQTKLESVLAHETAHIRRGDYLVSLLAEFNRALHWFNPLSWMLRRWLSELAEQNCDDAVIASTGERAQYARHLLEVATTLQGQKGRVAWAGIAMARKPNVETRINAILDAKRPLARRLGVVGAVLLIATTIPAILLAAALRPADEVSVTSQADSEGGAKDDIVEDAKESTKTFRGTVLDPDGKPVANAAICAENFGYNQKQHKRFHNTLAETTSNADGTFSLVVAESDQGINQVVAYAKGLAPAIARAKAFLDNANVTMHLAHDHPISGRVLDTEGNPISGVKVNVRYCAFPKNDEVVAEWIAKEKPELFAGSGEKDLMFYNDAQVNATRFPVVSSLQRKSLGMPEGVTTDADGRFRISGLGKNRLAALELLGPTIATQRARVVTRDMKSILAYVQGDESSDFVHHGSSPTLIAHPTQPIVGQVVASDSGEPLPHMAVKISRIGKSTWASNWPNFTTSTDAEGRFRLEGAPLGGRHRITVTPALDLPYFKTDLDLPESSGSAPLECLVELQRSKWIVGKVLDEEGDPVLATLNYYPYRDNKFAEQFANYDPKVVGSVPDNVFHTNEEGEFRIRAIPGKGVLAAHISDWNKRGVYVANIPEDLLERIGGEQMPRLYNSWSAKTFGAMVEVEIAPEERELSQDLTFKKGLEHELQIVDTEAKPISQVRVMGSKFPPGFGQPLKEPRVTLIGLRANDPRFVLMMHAGRKLGKAFTLTADDLSSLSTVKLEPCATLNGRIVNEDGEPVVGMAVDVSPVAFDPPRDNWGRSITGATTNEEGKFSVLLPPGCAYYISTYTMRGPNVKLRVKPVPGQIYKVGDLTDGADLDEGATNKLVAPKKQPSSVSATETHRIKGQVVGPDGKGTSATIHVVSVRSRGWMRQPLQKTLMKVPTDNDGNFDFEANLPLRDDAIELGDSPGVRIEQIVATSSGFGPAVSDVVEVRQGKPVELKLPKDDVPIEGRILNLEGEPVANAQIRVAMLNTPRDLDKTLDSLRRRAGEKPKGMMLGMFKASMAFESDTRYINERIAGNKLSYSTLVGSPVTTDRSGRFRLDGIGRDRIMALELSGPGIVTSWISVASRDMKPIGKTHFIGNRTDRTYGAKFTFSAEPEQVIGGRITDVDSGEPIAGIKVELPDNTGFATSTTDSLGRYRLVGMPKKAVHRLSLEPAKDLPYFPQRHIEVKDFAEGLQATTLNFQVKKSTWIKGAVRDKVTGKPVKARVMFSPHVDNPAAKAYSLRKGQYIDPIRMKDGAVTDEQGNFRVRAVPGEGVLAVLCEDRGYCPAHGAESLDKKWMIDESFGSPARINAYHTMALGWMHGYRSTIAKKDETLIVDLEVDSGNSLRVQLVDPDGKPLSGVHVRNRFPFSWNSEAPQDATSVDLVAINPKQPRTVMFYHRERNLGACILADQSERSGERTITLEPCGVVKGRLVSKDGKPITNVGIGIKQVTLVNDSYEAVIPYAETDEDGKFEIQRYTPSTKFSIHTMYGPEREFVADSVEIKPEEIRDLGTITLTKTKSRPQPNGAFQVGQTEATPANEQAGSKRR